jgi:hypothetical protein
LPAFRLTFNLAKKYGRIYTRDSRLLFFGERKAALFRLRVIDHATDIDHYQGFVPHHPGIMTGRSKRHVPRSELVLAPVIHHHVKTTTHVILKMRGFTAFGIHQRFDRGGPSPPRLKGSAPKGNPPIVTSSSFPWSKIRVSSGESMFSFLHLSHP